MRLEIRYVNSFEYSAPVRESHNELRARPTEHAHQRLLDYRVTVDPTARVLPYVDYWGTAVDAFGIRRSHSRLTVAADAIVDTSPQQVPDVDVGMAAYGEPFAAQHWQLLQPSPHTGWSGELAATAAGLAGEADGAVAIARRIAEGVNEMLDYVPGTTDVGVDVNEVVARGKGVCQDFAHVAIAMYRSLGVPARYVSGYLYAADQSVGDAPEEAEIVVQTHAWVEVAIPGWGWWPLDPTNSIDVGERHVKIGHGRDYDDVMPLRGVYHGPSDHTLGVSVRISREEMSAFQQQ